MVSLAKKTMHQRPTYETLVRDTILEPRDKINLPNRKATLLRSNQKLQMFDDESFLDLDEENKRIAAERMQQMEFTRMVHDSPDADFTTERATQTQPPDNPPDSSNRKFPPAPPPPHEHPKMIPKNTQTTSDTATVGTQASFKPPPPPPGKTVGTQARPENPAMVDVGIDADQQFIKDKMRDAIEEQLEAKRRHIATADSLVRANLGPSASNTANPDFVSRLVLHIQPKKKKEPVVLMDTSDNIPPPPPPGAGAISFHKPTRKPMYEKQYTRPKNKKKSDPMETEISPPPIPPPQPDPPTAGVTVKIGKKKIVVKKGAITKASDKVPIPKVPAMQTSIPKAKQQSKPTIAPGIQVPIPKARPRRKVVADPSVPRPSKRPASDNIYLPKTRPSKRAASDNIYLPKAKAKPRTIAAPSITTPSAKTVVNSKYRPTPQKPSVRPTITKPKVEAPHPSRVSVARAVLLLTSKFLQGKNASPQLKRDATRARELAEEHKKKLSKDRKKAVNTEIKQLYRNYYPSGRA